MYIHTLIIYISLSKDISSAYKELKADKSLHITKADKSNALVILKRLTMLKNVQSSERSDNV